MEKEEIGKQQSSESVNDGSEAIDFLVDQISYLVFNSTNEEKSLALTVISTLVALGTTLYSIKENRAKKKAEQLTHQKEAELKAMEEEKLELLRQKNQIEADKIVAEFITLIHDGANDEKLIALAENYWDPDNIYLKSGLYRVLTSNMTEPSAVIDKLWDKNKRMLDNLDYSNRPLKNMKDKDREVYGGNYTNTQIIECTVQNSEFYDIEGPGLQYDHSTYEGCRLYQVNIPNGKIIESYIAEYRDEKGNEIVPYTSMEDCNLSGTEWVYSPESPNRYPKLVFRNCNLSNMNWGNISFEKIKFEGENTLDGGNFSKATDIPPAIELYLDDNRIYRS